MTQEERLKKRREYPSQVNRPFNEKRKAANARYYAKHRPRLLKQRREHTNFVRYGITQADYDRMLVEQGGHCAMCSAAPPRLSIDHDHATGRVRGLLCQRCNIAVGFAEQPELMDAAREYLS